VAFEPRLRHGRKSLDDLCAEVGVVILVTGFLGGNSNSITGDYSFGVQGFRIERASARPLSTK
jgi:PmbA protein